MNKVFTIIAVLFIGGTDIIAQEQSQVTEAVDLGLSVKWASFNVGATSPEEYGTLFGWGQPDMTVTSENLDDYPTAIPPTSICGTEYDIATVNWGNDWRMPTQAEFEELATKCSWEWSALNGINGMTVTGTNGCSIFLPAAASRTGEAISNQVGQRGCYWSGTLWPSNSNFAAYLYFYSDASRVQPVKSNRRYIGMSVRPVANEDGAGVNDIFLDRHGDFSVLIDGAILRIRNISESIPITIYDIMGKLIYNGSKHDINIEKPGVYLIQANDVIKKIII